MGNKLEGFGLRDLVDGFLSSLKAEGRSSRTTEYYTVFDVSKSGTHCGPDK